MTDTATKEITVTIPMSPSPCLSPNARRRGNVWEQREATKILREATWWAVRAVIVPEYDCLEFGFSGTVDVHEHIVWPKGQRLFDPDGLASMAKAALDGIVDAGLIAGDSAKHIRRISSSQEKGTERQGKIVITITEAIA